MRSTMTWESKEGKLGRIPRGSEGWGQRQSAHMLPGAGILYVSHWHQRGEHPDSYQLVQMWGREEEKAVRLKSCQWWNIKYGVQLPCKTLIQDNLEQADSLRPKPWLGKTRGRGKESSTESPWDFEKRSISQACWAHSCISLAKVLTGISFFSQLKKQRRGMSLVVPWLRIHLATQRTGVQSLVQELKFPHAAGQLNPSALNTKSTCCNHGSPCSLKPALCSKRGHRNEHLCISPGEQGLLAPVEEPHSAEPKRCNGDPVQAS